MIIFDSVNKSLEVVLTGSVSTQLPVTSSFVDLTATTLVAKSNDTASNNTTAVTVVAAPGSLTQRQLKWLSVFNPNSSTATVVVNFKNSGTTRNIVKVQLVSGSTLQYNSGDGWKVITTYGELVVTAPVQICEGGGGGGGGDTSGSYFDTYFGSGYFATGHFAA